MLIKRDFGPLIFGINLGRVFPASRVSRAADDGEVHGEGGHVKDGEMGLGAFQAFLRTFSMIKWLKMTLKIGIFRGVCRGLRLKRDFRGVFGKSNKEDPCL